jgi:hypothetical protein
MIAKKKEFLVGFGLIIGFVIVLILFFLPIYAGMNGLNYLDDLYNSISKGSAYYIPKVKEKSDKFLGKSVSVKLIMKDSKEAEETALLFMAGGARADVSKSEIEVEGDLGKILENCLSDADAMYHNDGTKVLGKYGYDEKGVLFNWWMAFKEMDKDLKKQKRFKEADLLSIVQKKAVESSYNYYKIQPQKIGDRIGMVVFSLIFYILYTLWYGFAMLFMFEGWGLRLGH